ncbi:MAG: CPBP family intramembrane metalloprotease [Bacteroidota bacterium]|nr:CPBP family intramembrane metalloprotease [Bacteroidota bacterium]
MKPNTFLFLARSTKQYLGGCFLSLFIPILGIVLYQIIVERLGIKILEIQDLNVRLIYMLLPFTIFIILFLACVHWIQKRRIKSLFTAFPTIRWMRIFSSFLIWFFINVLADLVYHYVFQGEYHFSFNPNGFTNLILISITLLFIQTTTEEILVRGFLLQNFAQRYRIALLPIIWSSIIFMLLHNSNPEIEQFGFWPMSIFYFSVAFIMCVIAVLDNGLEIPLGLHAATNFYGACIVGYEGGALKTYSLFTIKDMNAPLMITMNLLSILVFYFIINNLYSLSPVSTLTENLIDEEV